MPKFATGFLEIVRDILGPIGMVQITGNLLRLKAVSKDLSQCKRQSVGKTIQVMSAYLKKERLELEINYNRSSSLGPLLACTNTIARLQEKAVPKSKQEKTLKRLRERQRKAFQKYPREESLNRAAAFRNLYVSDALHPRFYPEFEELLKRCRDGEELEKLLAEEKPLPKKRARSPSHSEAFDPDSLLL